MRHDQLQGYVDSLKPILNLSDWVFEVKEGAPEDTDGKGEAGASFNSIYGRRRAHLKFGRHFWDEEGPREQAATVAHEMLHAHLEDVWDATATVKDELAPTAYRVFNQAVVVAIEYATDQLAEAFAPFLPLPPEDTEETPS